MGIGQRPVEVMVNAAFWNNKRVLLTGHTGFKGCWMASVLQQFGAKIDGIALPPDGTASLFSLLSPWQHVTSHMIDIRDRDALRSAVVKCDADIVIHMAAQALVRRSFDAPLDTFDTNIMGSLNLLDALAARGNTPPVLVITSDKVYANHEQGERFREGDALGGDDPYSASKAACEIAVHAFAKAHGQRVATARGGNVVGGGDFAADRLLPDAFRAMQSGTALELRNPSATRPWQHVLDVVFGYLHYAEQLFHHETSMPHALNIGPADAGLSVQEVIAEFSAALGHAAPYRIVPDPTKPEKRTLELDTSLARSHGITPLLSQHEAIGWAGDWYRHYHAGASAADITHAQIETYRSMYDATSHA